MKPWKLIVLVPVLAVAIVGAVLLVRWESRDAESYTRVTTVSDERLLVVSRLRNRHASGTYASGACARVSLLRLDGVIERSAKDCSGWIRLAGLGPEMVWLNSADRGLHARRTDDLSLVQRVEDALAAHPILSRPGRGNHKAYVMGMSEGRVVLEGADQRLYTVASNGTIEQQERGFRYRARASNPNSNFIESVAIGKASVPTPEGRVRVADLDGMVDPQVVVRNGEDDPVLLTEPRSAIVVSRDIMGPQGRQQLSRVTFDDEILWTVQVRDLAGPIDLGRPPGYHTVWVDVLGDQLWAFIQASVWIRRNEGENYGKYAARLVRIDPLTGEALEIHEIVKDSDS
jgi:hypothetical protein